MESRRSCCTFGLQKYGHVVGAAGADELEEELCLLERFFVAVRCTGGQSITAGVASCC